MNVDSVEYEVLLNAVIAIKNIKGLTCEIGVREGGSTKMILDMMKYTNQKKVHIAIDPFGNIDYSHWETMKNKMDYTNKVSKVMYEIDAKNAVVGRLATIITKIIRGKNKTTYTPHMDDGDFVVVKNIEQIRFTGKKFFNKKYKYKKRGNRI